MNGFQNEDEIIQALNDNSFRTLNTNLQHALLTMNNFIIPKKISAKKYGQTEKADLSITIDNTEYFVSVKKGSGNSIHQEKIEDFILFLEDNYETNESVFNDLRHFVWCDNSLDGTGKVEERLDTRTYKKLYPEKIANIQSYFDRYKTQLIDRFLISGGHLSNTHVDFLLYGTINACIVVSRSKFIKYALKVKKPPISIGFLTFQVYNRRLTFLPKHENRRGQIQLKWGTLKNDLIKINEQST